MTREIKFRGLSSNGMVFGDLTHDMKGTTAYYDTHPCRISWHEGNAYHNSPVQKGTVEQFTGLHDKNGVEIYEGDCISVSDPDKKYQIQEVVFKDGAFCGYSNRKHCPHTLLDTLIRAHEVKVIRNICENPELQED